MTRFIIRRTLQAVAVLLLVSLMMFTLVHLLPGGAAKAELGVRASPSQIKAFNIANGYNRPVVEQYFFYLNNLIHGRLGFSYVKNESVSYLLKVDLPKSLYLSGLALFFTLLIAIPLGVYQAVRRNKPDDFVLTGMSFVGYSMPTFWLGLLLIAFFSVYWKVFPSEGPQAATVSGAISDPRGMFLPVLTLTIVGVASFSRYMRSSAIESLAQDYIRTARAKGVTQRGILFGHMLRNALLPIVTLVGLSVPALLAGNLITEQVFNFQGVGLLYFSSAETRDYPTLLALTMVVAAATVVGSLLADIGYGLIDRRVRVS